ncbi:MAG: curli production assembly/transport protein CsgE [Bacteroidales bacterium]|nr:curli production assembly/transport protein CsgE [Bacteroidales bacterium]
MNRFLLVISMILIANFGVKAQKIDSIKQQDTIKKEVPAAIQELVRQYDKQVKEANKKRQQVRVVDPPASEIDGIIMDETMSKSGRDFYEIFFANWQRPRGYRNFYIKIKEKPFRMNTTLIEVYLKEQLMYQQILKRRFDEVEQMTKQAVLVVQRQIYYELRAQQALKQQYKSN